MPTLSNRTAIQTRSISFEMEGRALADGRIPVVISTDAPVEMCDGIEILDHSPSAIDLVRAPLPIVATHRDGQVNVGVVEDLYSDGHRLRGFARFGERQEAKGYELDVLNGVIRSVSVGYRRIKGKVQQSGVLLTTRWMPFHVAMVAEPADAGAGFFREAEGDLPFVIEVEESQAPAEPIEDATPEPAAPAALAPEAPAVPATPNPSENRAMPALNISEEAAAARAQETTRVREINALGEQFEKFGARKIAAEAIESGATVDAVRSLVMNAMAAAQTAPVTSLGMSRSDVKRYSVLRAIRAMVDRDWKGAGIEAEVHKAICQRAGIDSSPNGGFFVPTDVQHRDLTVGTPTAGGNLVSTDLRASSFIELLRARSVLGQLGATMLPGLVGAVAIPKQTGAATAYWLANEATAATESQQTIGQLALAPKNIAAYTELSRQLLLQSTPAADALVMDDLSKVLALGIDLAGLEGSGASGQPTGIANTAGIGSVVGTTLGLPGIVEFQTDVASGNALTAGCKYLTTPSVAGLLKQRQRFASTDTPIWQGNVLDGEVDGFGATTTTQLTAASIIFGDFSQVVIGEWGFLELALNPYANFAAAISGIRAIQTVDVGIRQAAAFSRATSIT